MADFGDIELAAPFDMHAAGRFLVLEGCDRRLEITGVGQAIGADGPAIRHGEFGAVILADIAAPAVRLAEPRHLEHHAARDEADLVRLDIHDAHFGEHPDGADLRHDQQLTIGIEKIVVDHVGIEGIGVRRHADLGHDIAGRRHGADALDKIHRRLGHRDRIPAQLPERQRMFVEAGRGFPEGIGRMGEAARMAHAGADAIKPGTLVGAARGGEGRAGKLLGIKPVIAFLRAVLPLRQGAGQGLRLEVIAEARHIGKAIARRRKALAFRNRLVHVHSPPRSMRRPGWWAAGCLHIIPRPC